MRISDYTVVTMQVNSLLSGGVEPAEQLSCNEASADLIHSHTLCVYIFHDTCSWNLRL